MSSRALIRALVAVSLALGCVNPTWPRRDGWKWPRLGEPRGDGSFAEFAGEFDCLHPCWPVGDVR